MRAVNPETAAEIAEAMQLGERVLVLTSYADRRAALDAIPLDGTERVSHLNGAEGIEHWRGGRVAFRGADRQGRWPLSTVVYCARPLDQASRSQLWHMFLVLGSLRVVELEHSAKPGDTGLEADAEEAARRHDALLELATWPQMPPVVAPLWVPPPPEAQDGATPDTPR